jgi:hypothetical protein
MVKKILVCCSLLILAFVPWPAGAQNPFIHNYTTFDGLPSNTVYQVYQDSRKFIWFATDAGVARFDGTNFILYSKQDGLSCNDVVHIKEDSSGRIWFFNMDATLNFLKDGVIYNERNAPFLDSLRSVEFFRDFYEDESHTLYFYYNFQKEIFALDTTNKVIKYRLPSYILTGLDGRPVEGMVIRYLNRENDWFYLWTIGGLFRTMDLNIAPELVVGTKPFKGIYPNSKDNFFIAVKGQRDFSYGIVKMKDMFSVDPSAPVIGTNSEFISAVLQDYEGYEWISLFDEGVFCYKGKELIRHFDIKEPQAIIEDNEKNIWISSLKEGVYVISPFINTYKHFENKVFDGHGILALASHLRNGTWMTNGKDIYLYRNDKFQKLEFPNHGNYLNQLLQVDDNTLAAGELSTNYYAIGGIRPDERNGRIDYSVIRVSPTPYKVLNPNRSRDEITTCNFFTIFRLKPELFDNVQSVWIGERVFYTYYNPQQDLVVNASKNFLLKHDTLVPYEKLAAFNSRIITGNIIIDDSSEILNIEGDSIFILSGRKTVNLSAAWDYPADLHVKYMDYYYPYLFLATSRNVYICINPLNAMKEGEAELQMIEISFRNIHDILFADHRLIIASDDGLTAISEETFRQPESMISPVPYFLSVEINDLPQSHDNGEVVLTGRNKIFIDFSSVNYSFSPVIYSYMLEGLDEDWHSGRGGSVVYESLPKGDYTFKLRARKPTSSWSEPVEYKITIRATLWEHPLFYMILFVVATGIGLVIILLRKNAEIKKREMEHQLVLLEQRALQSMMNPHFIFNSLGSIQNYLLQSKPGEAGIYLSQFARLIRQNLNASNAAMISLEEEVDRLKNYLDLERMRMEKKFEYSMEMDDQIESDEVLIPSMIVQPFVENSIWHGISNMDGTGLIRISFRLKDEKSMKIIVEDNGIGMKSTDVLSRKSEKHLRMGMAMTRKRMDLLGKKYNIETRIDISETHPGKAMPGTRVEMVVPYLWGKDSKE